MAVSSFVNKILETEELGSHKSFSKEYVHRDQFNKRPTTVTCSNSDFAFGGKFLSSRRNASPFPRLLKKPRQERSNL